MSSIEIRQIDKTDKMSQDKRIVAAILEHGDLAKAARALDITKDDIKARYRSKTLKPILLAEIEEMLILDHLPAALRYLLAVVRGDVVVVHKDVVGHKERITVAKTLLDRVGLGATKARPVDDDSKPLEEMTVAELQAFLAVKESRLPVVSPAGQVPAGQAVDWLE